MAGRLRRPPASRKGRTPLRPLATPSPVQVRTDGRERPVALVPPGRRRLQRVDAVREVWRIDDEWWRRPVSRLYHEVVLETGGTLVVYRDLEEGGWYVH